LDKVEEHIQRLEDEDEDVRYWAERALKKIEGK
jgi:HEAT repeat protein